MPQTIRIAASPDADDLFMMRAILIGAIDTGCLTFEVKTFPTDELNRMGAFDQAEVLAMSMASWPALRERWQLLPHGGSLGEGYGPVVVAKEPCTPAQLRGKRVAIPGASTTAWAVLRMITQGIEPVEIPIVPHKRVFEALEAGEVDAALLIHEGRLTYPDYGLHAIVDIGVWWSEQTAGLPLPLGVNTIRRDLGPEKIAQVSQILRASIAHGLNHRDEAIAWLLEHGDGALHTPAALDRYLGMYANERTFTYGPEGLRGIDVFLRKGADAGLFPRVQADFSA